MASDPVEIPIIYYVRPDGQGSTQLTTIATAVARHWTDDQLIEEAVAEAYRGDIVSRLGDDSRLSEDALRAGLVIEWEEPVDDYQD